MGYDTQSVAELRNFACKCRASQGHEACAEMIDDAALIIEALAALLTLAGFTPEEQ